jgi:hypothetical protein
MAQRGSSLDRPKRGRPRKPFRACCLCGREGSQRVLYNARQLWVVCVGCHSRVLALVRRLMDEKKRKYGPAPLAPGVKRRNRGALILNDSEFNALQSHCESLNVPMASFVRALILAAVCPRLLSVSPAEDTT